MELPQFVDARNMSRHGAANNFNTPRHRVPLLKSVGRRFRSDLNDADAWVVDTPIMDTIAEIAHPRFQLRRIVPEGVVRIRLPTTPVYTR